jgi:hypothetical protein
MIDEFNQRISNRRSAVFAHQEDISRRCWPLEGQELSVTRFLVFWYDALRQRANIFDLVTWSRRGKMLAQGEAGTPAEDGA